MDVGQVITSLRERYFTNPEQRLSSLIGSSDALKSAGTFGNDLLRELRANGDLGRDQFSSLLASAGLITGFGDAQGNAIIGKKDSDNYLMGLSGNDTLIGGDGDDSLRVDRYARDNILAGGTGNDTLYDSASGDTYLFNLGDG